MTIKAWPNSLQPREKLLANGVNSLSDTELLALMLGSGQRGQTAVDLAHIALAKHQDFYTLSQLSIDEFCLLPGFGKVRYCQWHAALEIAKRSLGTKLKQSQVFDNSQQTKHYLASQLCGYQQEVFACLFLDHKHHLIAFEKLAHGTIDHATVHIRTIAQYALRHNASSVILAHNHPSGDSAPSQHDIDITRHIRDKLAYFDVSVLDHIVVGRGHTSSIMELGVL